MAHIDSFEKLAERLFPLFMEEGERALVKQGFIDGGHPKRENWKQVLNAVFYAPLMRIYMDRFLKAEPALKPTLVWRYASSMQLTATAIKNYGHESAPEPFDPHADLTHLLMAQRIPRHQLITVMAMLVEQPHFIATLIHAQQFYMDYKDRFQEEMMKRAAPGSPEAKRMARIFARITNVIGGNQDLFMGVMGFQYMMIHQHLAAREGRAQGELTFKDFMEFDRFVREGKLFVQQGKVCPFSDAYRTSMMGKAAGEDGQSFNLSGVQLWRLHQHIAPAAAAMRSELSEYALLAGMAISKAVYDEQRSPTSPRRPAQTPDDLLVAELVKFIG